MNKVHESKVIDGKIAYFRFLKGNPVDSYGQGLEEFKGMVQSDSLDTLMVVVEDDDAMFGKDMQKVWLDTGEFADQNSIIKWGVAVPNLAKQITIEYLIQGGDDAVREYDHFVSDSENEILEWCKE